MRRLFGLFLLLSFLPLCLAAQDRRIAPIAVPRKQALVIGNSAYARSPLKNPVNDAVAMEAALRSLGFEVRTLTDLDQRHMEEAIDSFAASISPGSLALFYFSGHGMQVNGVNYLLPVDFAASSEADVKWRSYPAAQVQEKMEESGARIRVLVLDACRNNPYHFRRDTLGGLAPAQVNAEGTLIAYSTGDNNTADDNSRESNGIYTKHLIAALGQDGLSLRDVFDRAKQDVYFATQKAQNPSIYDNVVGKVYLGRTPMSDAVAKPRPAPVVASLDPADELWDRLKDSKIPDDFDDFCRQFEASPHCRVAQGIAAHLRREAAAAASPAGSNASIPRPNVPSNSSSAGMNAVSVEPYRPQPLPPRPATTGNITIRDPAEFNAYQMATNQGSASAKISSFESFLNKYPVSAVRGTVLDQLMDAYAATNNTDGELSAASRQLQDDPQNLKAALFYVMVKKSQAMKAADAEMAHDVAEVARRGLAVSRPEDTSEENWKRMVQVAHPIFRSALAGDAALTKNYAAAIAEYREELSIMPEEATRSQGLPDTLQLAQTYSQLAQEQGDQGGWAMAQAVWFYCRAWDFAPAAYKTQIEPKAEYWYKKYHGRLDGLDAIKSQAASRLFPPSE